MCIVSRSVSSVSVDSASSAETIWRILSAGMNRNRSTGVTVSTSTGSAATTGVVAFAETLPYVVVLALGGPVVDRFRSASNGAHSASCFGSVRAAHTRDGG